jgi:hypothetical protein
MGSDSVIADVEDPGERRPTRSPSQCDSGLVGAAELSMCKMGDMAIYHPIA